MWRIDHGILAWNSEDGDDFTTASLRLKDRKALLGEGGGQ
jgi:hypothetical protein